MNWNKSIFGFALILVIIFASVQAVSASPKPPVEIKATLLATGLQGGSGSTVGPDDALYVTEGEAGRVSRIDPRTGNVTTFASGLPTRVFGLGGAIDIAFINKTAYVLVTMVGEDIGGTNLVGIYRVDGPDSFTVVADIGEFSLNNPSNSIVFIPTGVQYAMQPYKGGFLVTDGHHNRLLWAGLNGEVKELAAFDNIVPTGLAVKGSKIYMAEAGPNPHLAADGKVVTLRPMAFTPREVGSGARLLVDVEFYGSTLFGLSQGYFMPGNSDGSPAEPNTGSLGIFDKKGGAFRELIGGLNQPTSLEFIKKTAYVVTLAGEVWKIENFLN